MYDSDFRREESKSSLMYLFGGMLYDLTVFASSLSVNVYQKAKNYFHKLRTCFRARHTKV